MSNLDEFSKHFSKEKSVRKIFAQVFDKETVQSIHNLAKRKHIDLIEYVLSTGKEAHVFRAIDKSGNFRAVKIYKIETSKFKQMSEYIDGDIRFKNVPKNKRDLVFAWTKKEFKNLQKISDAGVFVPLPLAYRENVLVMEFIGENGIPAKTLKENPIKDLNFLYSEIVEAIAKMFFKAELIHSDLSEYNILNFNDKPVIIDCGQSVLTSHPNAEKFFNRDLQNMSNYFSKQGLKIEAEQMKKDIKSLKTHFLG